jgi:hypothetical protein
VTYEGEKLKAELARARAALLDLYANIAGHYEHFDPLGNAGRTCPGCVRQREARERARPAILETREAEEPKEALQSPEGGK